MNYSIINIKLVYGYEQTCCELTKLLLKSIVDLLLISTETSRQCEDVVAAKKGLGK